MEPLPNTKLEQQYSHGERDNSYIEFKININYRTSLIQLTHYIKNKSRSLIKKLIVEVFRA